MTGRAFLRVSVFAILGLALPGEARAVSQEVIQACRVDVKRLCPFTDRGSEKRRECLREHRSELSKDCVDAIRKSRASKS